jgi:hypothetical protein
VHIIASNGKMPPGVCLPPARPEQTASQGLNAADVNRAKKKKENYQMFFLV